VKSFRSSSPSRSFEPAAVEQKAYKRVDSSHPGMLNQIVNLFSGRGYLLQPDAADYLMNQSEPLTAAELLASRLLASQAKSSRVITLDLLRRLEVVDGQGFAISSPEAAVLVAHAEALAAKAVRDSSAVSILDSGTEIEPSAAGSDSNTRSADDEVGPFVHRIQILQDSSREPATEGTVQDFAKLFRSRLEKQREFLRRGATVRVVSVEAASHEGSDVAFVGLVRESRVTKFGTVSLEVEDETGFAKVSIGSDLAKSWDDIVQDEVLMIRARPAVSRESGHVRRLTAKELHRPELSIPTPIRRGGSSVVAFVSDIHVGSRNFMKEEWKRFVEWLRSGDELARRVKYLVAVGDVVDGVGVYPNQEADLEIETVREQYRLLAEITAEIREDIKIIMMPGNHDAVRPAEPQPTFPDGLRRMFDRDRFMFLSNPAMLKIEDTKILGYHGKSLDDIIAHVPHLSYQRPLEAMVQLLKRRHLAPVYGDKTPLAPLHDDKMVISDTPDVFVCGHIHVAAMGEYRGMRLINAGAWQKQTAFQKVHNITPLAARVPMMDLRTMEMSMPDFSG